MPEPTVFGRRLKQTREARGLTQEELAERAGLAPTAVSHFETGVRGKPSADNLVKLAEALAVTIDYLLGRTDAPEVNDPRVAALLRSLSGTTTQRYEDFIDMAEWFVRDRGKEGKGGSSGRPGPEEGG